MACLGCAVHTKEDMSLHTQDLTLTDQYLLFESHQPLEHTLAQDQEKKQKHLRSTLKPYGYSNWAMKTATRFVVNNADDDSTDIKYVGLTPVRTEGGPWMRGKMFQVSTTKSKLSLIKPSLDKHHLDDWESSQTSQRGLSPVQQSTPVPDVHLHLVALVFPQANLHLQVM